MILILYRAEFSAENKQDKLVYSFNQKKIFHIVFWLHVALVTIQNHAQGHNWRKNYIAL